MSITTWPEARGALDAGLDKLDMQVSASARSQLIHYLEILTTWNATYNLTAVREVDGMVVRHLLDCLTLLPMLTGRSLADVGSGAGLPGLIVAITQPRINVTLIESNRKKAAFLRHARRELELSNTRVVQQRVEDWACDEQYEIVTARAFASIADCIAATEHLLVGTGEYVLMKGVEPVDEVNALRPGWQVIETRPVEVPELDAERHIIRLGRDLL